jgi:glycosyltransferase involved in cell wall biosynthesis
MNNQVQKGNIKYILHIAQLGNKIGGIETAVMNLYENINKQEYQFGFVTTEKESRYEKKIHDMGGEIYFFPSPIKHPIKYYRQLKVLQKKYVIVQIHKNSLCNSVPIFMCKICRFSNIIIHSHNTSATGRYKFIKNCIHYIMKCIISFMRVERVACSNLAAKWMFSPKDDVYILHNGIDIKKFHFDKTVRGKKREELGISQEEVVIGNVARFMKEKNQQYLINILAHLTTNGGEYKLLFVGDGPLTSECRKKVKSLGLEDKVLFLGKRTDTNELYQAMDIFALPSLHEGLPLVGVEAQIAGLTCLFSDTITDELLMTSHAVYLNLQDMKNWVETIQNWKCNLIERENDAALVQDKGYDIIQTTKGLEKYYLNMLKEK